MVLSAFWRFIAWMESTTYLGTLDFFKSKITAVLSNTTWNKYKYIAVFGSVRTSQELTGEEAFSRIRTRRSVKIKNHLKFTISTSPPPPESSSLARLALALALVYPVLYLHEESTTRLRLYSTRRLARPGARAGPGGGALSEKVG